MATTVRPTAYLTFWKKYDADLTSMMLNQNAEQLEQSDRFDILSELPDYTNKTVVDCGAGIGRFTSTFAEKAKHVISTDFIDSFIQKNRERNAHFNNISYQVSDASSLQLDSKSTDLLFTNWLLMYLSDVETVDFLKKSLNWLTVGGSIHIRESCTESSTAAKSTNGSLHTTENNPTHYRHASVYLQLLRELRWRDAEGKLWRFEIRWSHSVPTYIEKLCNWRQVHWLAEKVEATEGSGLEDIDALVMGMTQTHILQEHTDFFLDNKPSWADAVFEQKIQSSGSFGSGSTILTYSPRVISPLVYVNAHLLAKADTLNVWAVENNSYFYSASLKKCNNERNQSVRYAWNKDLISSLEYWQTKDAQFDGFVSTELLFASGERSLKLLKTILSAGSHLFMLEPAVSLKDFEEKHAAIIQRHFNLISLVDVSAQIQQCQQKQWFDSANQRSPCWLLVHARF